MELLPEDVANQLPPLYSQETKGSEALAVVKFFFALVELDLVRQRIRPRGALVLRSGDRTRARGRVLQSRRAAASPWPRRSPD